MRFLAVSESEVTFLHLQDAAFSTLSIGICEAAVVAISIEREAAMALRPRAVVKSTSCEAKLSASGAGLTT